MPSPASNKRVAMGAAAAFVVLNSLVITLAALLIHRRRAVPRAPGRRVTHTQGLLDVVNTMDDKRFRTNFRVPKSVYHRVLGWAKAHPVYQPSTTNRHRFISVGLQVLVALWRQGRSATMHDAMELFGVCAATVMHAEWRFRMMLLSHEAEVIKARWPRTAAQCAAAAAKMSARVSRFGFPNCIGALDGTLIPVLCPRDMVDVLYTRKGFPGINHQVVCDGEGYIMFASLGRVGTVHDSTCLRDENGELGQLIQALPSPYYVIADSGYTATAKVLTPYKRPANAALTPAQRTWNYSHSLMRGPIEKVFGILKMRNMWMLRGAAHKSLHTYSGRIQMRLHLAQHGEGGR
jgi:hypothetical protein